MESQQVCVIISVETCISENAKGQISADNIGGPIYRLVSSFNLILNNISFLLHYETKKKFFFSYD